MVCRSMARVLGMTGLCVALIAPSVSSQTEAVELRFKLKPDETLRYKVVQSALLWTTVDVGGVIRTSLNRQSTTIREEITVLAVDEDGVMSLEVTRQETKTTPASRSAEQLPLLTVTVRPNGEIVKGVSDLGTGYFPIGLPDHAVSPGESWTYQQKGVSLDITKEGLVFLKTDFTITPTLMGVDRVGEDRVARVQIKGEGLLDTNATFGTFDAAVQVKGSSTVHVTGEASWSIDSRRLARIREEFSFELPIEVAVEGRTFQGKSKWSIVEEREPISGSN